ncbi:hypothetical protein [Spirosoma rhododendri]|uniref:Uncharacterized protein n=1 Tax=Spirosoma rhododendri TaxID=2728024 RepID=A0A7L5DQU8_9BACT|nr:hypothetical protein [Spirosoma rhododendri]QJD80819.1 hypothetical protein HH216_22140 [Spirosoma rhododendri]
MYKLSTNPNYRWLIASLCIWLLCAWVARQPVAQQPVPAKKASPKTRVMHRPATARKETGPVTAETLPTAATAVNPQGVVVDAETGLAVDDNMVLVKGQCTVCHNSKLVLQSHFDRDKWIERIRWMQRTQKLWDLGETEKPILDYLVKHYGPLPVNFDGRRLPLDQPKWHTR